MKNLLIICLLVFVTIIVLSSCSNDSSADKKKLSEIEDSTIINNMLSSKNNTLKDSLESKVDIEKNEATIKAREKSKNMLEKKIKNSPYDGLTCDQIIKKYEKMVKEIVAKPELLYESTKLQDFVNNIHHNHCKKVDSIYRIKVAEIDKLLEVLDDDDE